MRTRLMHGICMYHRQWLPGDERGWRSRDHKRHSSGDYKQPPPPQEHDGLRKWIDDRAAGDAIWLNAAEYHLLGLAFVSRMFKIGSPVHCLCSGCTHVHVMFDCSSHDAKHELARAKQYSSLKLKSRPGRIWADDCSVEEVRDAQHRENLWKYILDHEIDENAFVWRSDLHSTPTRKDIDQVLKALMSEKL